MSIETVKRYSAEQVSVGLAEAKAFIQTESLGDYATKLVDKACSVEFVLADDVAGLIEAMKMLMRGYVNTLEGGRDRIVFLGGQCDPLDKLEACDANLRIARNELARWQS